ncbi:MAG: TonB family protein [Chitinivibrionales bacterium]|nr:TonB family protein [Chitinivibrionales bacterium]MBD3396877.1 TonB family protein [Chitinivibrionales bacterium]
MKTFLRAILVLILLGLTAMFNIGLVDIRIQETDYLLGKVAADHEVANALGIVAKYELIKRRLESGEGDVQNYEFEAKMQALTSGDQFEREELGLARKLYLTPVRAVVNGIRLTLGKEIINPQEENKIYNVLEIGYFWERARKYPDAIKIYDQVIGMEGITHEIRAAVLLHKAFCHSMMSEYKNAKLIYERVINQYPNTDAGMLAWKLLDFIDSMERRREKVKEKRLDNFEKAKQFYLLMDYRNAIKYFSRFLTNQRGSSRAHEARFFKGRSHEELGETQEAIDEYRRVIRDGGSKRWAREANRRLLMLGEFYEQKQQMAEEARKQLAAYQDQAFMNNVGRFASMVSESSLRAELTKGEDAGPEEMQVTPDAQIMALLNSIGDLTGMKEAERKKKMAEQRQRWVEAGLSRKEIDERERIVNLITNPARQATALGRVIRDNSNQLKYIYNKRLRSGVPLSGKMIVEIKIGSDGTVRGTRIVESNLGDKQFEDAVLQRVVNWRFKPVPDSLGVYTLTYPFEFHQES